MACSSCRTLHDLPC
ncbi:hypothetical protein GOA91_20485 [Sinorhizobium meliloti]|nr:hypothetical protein [Sinorhizobium meliloti]MDX0275820.1 hypothetical protein [Sinorhizobium meliloti]MDX0297985.1 hypothetical protein [Sinorhizobium meliloti]